MPDATRTAPAFIARARRHESALANPTGDIIMFPGVTERTGHAGCCGMAGSFGYAREHYDISRRIGERRLMPAGARDEGWRGPGRVRHLMPPAGRALHRRPRDTSRGPSAVPYRGGLICGSRVRA